MEVYHNVQPVLLEQISVGYVIRWNLEETTIEGEPKWKCEETMATSRTYEAVVSALIHSKYTVDQELATINNHLLGEDEDEWAAYQAWRVWAKGYARNTLNLQ